MVAASASETLLTSFPKNSRDASLTPMMANDPRWPSGTSFRYISRISSFDALIVRMSETKISSTLRRPERSRADSSVMPSNFGRKTLRTSCCVMVLAPAMRLRRPVAYESAAPTMPMGSMPGCS
jgi:hypothetical protein